MPDDATPGDVSENGDATTGGLYDLASVPEDLRPHVEPHLKAIEANITKKLQENSEALKQWEPYKELGIADMNPEALQQLLEFAELAQDEDKFAEWFKSTGERLGLMGEPDDDLDLDLDDELSPEKIEQLISKAVAENMAPVNERFQAQEAKEAEQAATAEITQTLNELKEEHGDELDTDAILQLAYAYADEDPDNAITRGFEDYQRLVGKGEAGLFAKKANQPGAPEGPGRASNAPEKLTTGNPAETAKAVRAAALDRLRADRQAAA